MPQVKEDSCSYVRIGPLLKRAIELQRENIKKVTYDVCIVSDYDAGEVLAKKLLNIN